MTEPDQDRPSPAALGSDNGTRLMWLIRATTQAGLVVAAVAAFTLALGEPAFSGPSFGGLEPMTGFECLVWAVFYYPSNALLILSPVLVFFLCRNKTPDLQVWLAILSTISTAWVCYLPLKADPAETQIGCWTWAAAHCLSTIAFYIPVWRSWQTVNKVLPADTGRGFPITVTPKAERR